MGNLPSPSKSKGGRFNQRRAAGGSAFLENCAPGIYEYYKIVQLTRIDRCMIKWPRNNNR